MNTDNDRSVPELFNLEGKSALITGGAGGLGFAIAKGLCSAGANVALADINETAASKKAHVLSELGNKAIGLRMDAFDPASIESCLETVTKEFGDIHVLLNAAGGNMKDATISPDVDFFHLPAEALQKVVGLNLFAGAIHPCQIIGRHMASHGSRASIINISSMTAFTPLTRVVGYSAAKAAVSNFTQWLAVYMAMELKSKVRVNAIAPGFLLTQQNRYLLMDEEKLTPRGETIISHTPMGRFGDPEDLIGVTIWLASDASAFVTGTVLPIDGGFSAFSGV